MDPADDTRPDRHRHTSVRSRLRSTHHVAAVWHTTARPPRRLTRRDPAPAT